MYIYIYKYTFIVFYLYACVQVRICSSYIKITFESIPVSQLVTLNIMLTHGSNLLVMQLTFTVNTLTDLKWIPQLPLIVLPSRNLPGLSTVSKFVVHTVKNGLCLSVLIHSFWLLNAQINYHFVIKLVIWSRETEAVEPRQWFMAQMAEISNSQYSQCIEALQLLQKSFFTPHQMNAFTRQCTIAFVAPQISKQTKDS